MTPDEAREGLLVWEPGILEYGTIEYVRRNVITRNDGAEVGRYVEIDVAWRDGSAGTLGGDDLDDLQVVTFPDLSDPAAVEQWLANDAPGGP